MSRKYYGEKCCQSFSVTIHTERGERQRKININFRSVWASPMCVLLSVKPHAYQAAEHIINNSFCKIEEKTELKVRTKIALVSLQFLFLLIITARIRRMGKALFSQVSVHILGRVVTPSPFHGTSTGPMFFLGCTPVTGPRSLLGGTPVPDRGGRSGRRYSQAGMGVPPRSEWGYPNMGYPQPGMGCPPPRGYDSRGSILTTAGGMPFAFTQEDFLVDLCNLLCLWLLVSVISHNILK